jgi:Family of unknown function (DUF5999)
MCTHVPCCPTEDAADRLAARVIVARPEQGWSLLCNGVITFDDGSLLLPNGRTARRHLAMSAAAPASLAS